MIYVIDFIIYLYSCFWCGVGVLYICPVYMGMQLAEVQCMPTGLDQLVVNGVEFSIRE